MSNQENRESIENREINGSDSVDQSNRLSSTVESDTVGLTERLTSILIDEGDGDLLLGQNDRVRVLQWKQVMDLQVIGACRADERLKPLIRFNVFHGVGEDLLLAHLNQYFEASEVGMLVRYLCIPLVSIRVGKIVKQRDLLCPTTTRGNLNLTLLPTSDLRISFVGDDGCSERLCTLNSSGHCFLVTIKEILADNSGRSFVLKVSENESWYFWCSEKSRLVGNELLTKMKNLLQWKPSLAALTGISETRLDCFARHLRVYLVSSTTPSLTHSRICQLMPSTSKPSSPRQNDSQTVKLNSVHQGSLSPGLSSFEVMPTNLTSLRTIAGDKLRQHGENNCLALENPDILSTIISDASIPPESQKAKALKGTVTFPLYPSNLLEALGKSHGSFPMGSSLLPNAAAPSSLFTQIPTLERTNIHSFDFPAIFPKPLILPISQQVSTFTPIMCDPIVHIGQGYLVSVGPAISTAKISMAQMGPDAMLEKGARETLRRLLMSSSNSMASQSLMKGSISGSRGFYSGSCDVGALGSGFASPVLVSLSGGEEETKQCKSHEESENRVACSSGDEGFNYLDGGKD